MENVGPPSFFSWGLASEDSQTVGGLWVKVTSLAILWVWFGQVDSQGWGTMGTADSCNLLQPFSPYPLMEEKHGSSLVLGNLCSYQLRWKMIVSSSLVSLISDSFSNALMANTSGPEETPSRKERQVGFGGPEYFCQPHTSSSPSSGQNVTEVMFSCACWGTTMRGVECWAYSNSFLSLRHLLP
jgi:hypothetical protein